MLSWSHHQIFRKSIRPLLLLSALLLLAGASACDTRQEARAWNSGRIGDSTPASTAGDNDRIGRGEYLVTIGGCHDCHTPWTMGPDGQPGPDMSRMLSGHPEGVKVSPAPALPANSPWVWVGAGTNTAYSGPWGTSYTMNLTPDTNTGIGIWTEDMFIKTIRTGKHFGTSRPIMPPMPWFNYAKMTDEDLKAVYAFLRSIPPVSNRVPDYEPPAVVAEGPSGE